MKPPTGIPRDLPAASAPTPTAQATEDTPELDDTIHWVDGECRIRPEVRERWDDELWLKRPDMTEAQIRWSWGALEATLGITIGPPEPADVVREKHDRRARAARAGEAMIAALEAADGPAALAQLAEARRLNPVVAEAHVRAARERRLL
jgi:hypothetical protein